MSLLLEGRSWCSSYRCFSCLSLKWSCLSDALLGNTCFPEGKCLTRLDISDYVQSITKTLNLCKVLFELVEMFIAFKTSVLFFALGCTESALSFCCDEQPKLGPFLSAVCVPHEKNLSVILVFYFLSLSSHPLIFPKISHSFLQEVYLRWRISLTWSFASS